jgi:hypothetical protein
MGSNELRIDRAMRLWALGRDGDGAHLVENGNIEEYNKLIHKAPESWNWFKRPSLGRE